MENSAQNIMIEAARERLFRDAKIDVLSATQDAENEKARAEVARSFISDTLTVPTPKMQAYAVQASLGDDVYHEPTAIALETAIARLSGKEAALFMPSGTMSNQIGIRTHLKQPPYNVLCDHRAHIYKYEVGGLGFHSGAAVTPVLPVNQHHLTLEDVEANVTLGTDMHYAPTEVIALENTLNGTIIPQNDVLAIAAFARKEGIAMHLDGARLWHVAAETGIPLSELCAPFDSVSLCFSKGLGAPVGSCLVGNADFIRRARRFRKMFGGGMRQIGALVGAAAYAVSNNLSFLPGVHALTRKLEKGLEEIGCEITSRAETCMVFFDPTSIGVELAELIERAAALPHPIRLSGSRLVVHIQTAPETVDDFLTLVRTLAEEKRAAGFVRLAQAVKTNGKNGIYKEVFVRTSLSRSL
ncbi:hypothetical protein EW145_g685 [Phellinidium pouzarii]|uniref:Aromatic amino acid beta-eliminating lyase/threonine aldolase domain-containing protein n=1 Tax=Phellinidium pouzarii TaxID=167371 RepID=A0A4V3XDX5_9AGAM|nr:hypothetical protein EW145_g685 [Phellinidium pouzarii]